jgi:hypothetical protein
MVPVTETTSTTPTTPVIGGHGKTGRRVAERLAAAGRATRVASRSTTPAFDWHDASTWPGALDGVASAYVTFQPDLAVPGALEIIGAFGAAAHAYGLDHLVLLSGRGEDAAQACEVALAGAHIFDGHNSSFASGVEEALGRPARDFADFAMRAASTGVWDVDQP